jgi:uncharacterized protein YndB with AHSA1/START domain
MSATDLTPDPKLDLLLEREVDVPPALVWQAWTVPEHVMQWFTPKPYETIACEIDLRPGGRFFTVMRSPEGEEMPNDGCFLEVVPEQRLVFTSVMGPGFRPIESDLPFTAVVALEPTETGTRYSALALHGAQADATRHEEMGFHDGWGAALDQLVEYVKQSLR